MKTYKKRSGTSTAKSNVAANSISFNEWRTALEETREVNNAASSETVPNGWISAEMFARERPCTVRHAREQLAALVSGGRADRKKFRIQIGDGVRAIYHYRLKK